MIAHPKKGQRWTAKATQDHQRKANQSFFFLFEARGQWDDRTLNVFSPLEYYLLLSQKQTPQSVKRDDCGLTSWCSCSRDYHTEHRERRPCNLRTKATALTTLSQRHF